MKKLSLFIVVLLVVSATVATYFSVAQPPSAGGPAESQDTELLKQFDADENGWLNQAERKPARVAAKRAATKSTRRRRGGPPGSSPPEPGSPGPKVAPADVANYPSESLYDTSVMRTLFLTFENEDWEKELEDFHGTDVDVPATLMVDGKTYPNVGVRFRGQSSYKHISSGSKRSFNVSLDLADEKQRLYGYKSLNLLNSHGDPSMMSTVVYSHIARDYIPAPKANFVHVVVNGRSWGAYVNAQQFDKTFLKENFESSKGTRWKVAGTPWADGGLRYLGDDLTEYKSRFEMKSNDGKKAWTALVQLCQTLQETPLDQLESALDPILDIDGALKFLALDNVLVNSDGYWTRASDYSLFRDRDGKFHLVPHDMNEAFAIHSHSGGPGGGGPPGDGGPPRGRGGPPGGFRGGPPGGPGGAGGRPNHGSIDLDPLIGLDSERMALRSRLLAIPKLRERYMQYVHQIADESLDWEKLGPVVNGYRDLIDPLVKKDTRKLVSYEAFATVTRSGLEGDEPSLQKFAVQRSKFLKTKK